MILSLTVEVFDSTPVAMQAAILQEATRKAVAYLMMRSDRPMQVDEQAHFAMLDHPLCINADIFRSE